MRIRHNSRDFSRPAARSLAQVVPHLRMGGMQQVAKDLDAGLPSVGISSTLIALDTLTGPSRIYGAIHGWKLLLDTWKRPQTTPDAVMAHSMFTAALVLNAAKAARVQRRLVVVHGNRALIGTTKTRLLILLCSTGLCTDVIFCGKAAADSFAHLPAIHKRAHVVPNGVCLPNTETSHAEAPASSALRVIMAGRLVPEKNPQRLIAAVARCNRPVELLICGDGPEAEPLRAMARQLGAPVTFAGSVPQEELVRRYHESDVFAFPSLVEGLPLVVLEAAAAGLAVVASDLPFNHEVLGNAARYCDPDVTDDWAGALDDLARDPEERARLAAGALARAPLFSLESMVRGYADVLSN